MKKLLLVAAALPLTVGLALAQEAKEPPPSGGSVRGVIGVVGPDAFGYVGYQTGTAECSYQFVDISTTGTSVLSGDDAGAPQTLTGAPFNFYGTSITQLAVTTNGYLSTDPTDTGPDLSNDCPLPVPPSTGGGARIYALHDDLNMTGGTSSVFYQYFADCPRPSGWGAAEGCYVFQWNEATHFGGGGELFNFQAILYETSFGIVFQHGPGNPEAGLGSTTGIQNAAATVGLTMACDAANSIPASSAQCIYHPSFPFGSAGPNLPPPVPRPAVIPTSTTYGLALLAALLGIAGFVATRRRG